MVIASKNYYEMEVLKINLGNFPANKHNFYRNYILLIFKKINLN